MSESTDIIIDLDRATDVILRKEEIIATANAVPTSPLHDIHVTAQAMAGKLSEAMELLCKMDRHLDVETFKEAAMLKGFAAQLQAHHLDILDNMTAMKPLDLFGHAVTILRDQLEVYETNEPINRARGDIAQADLEAAVARSIKLAIARLERR